MAMPVDQFSYLSVLLSIIIGLAITQILQGFRGIVLSRSRVLMYWPALVWAAMLLLLNVQSWWAMFDLREVVTWTFPKFAVVLAQTITQYLLAGIVLPDFPADAPIDLRRHYFAHTRWFFFLLVLMLFISLSKPVVLTGHLTDRTDLGFHAAFIVMATTAAFTQREWYHKIMSLSAIVLLVIYIAALFMRLQ